jgi:hypothetical protein
METPRDSLGNLVSLTPGGVSSARLTRALTTSYYHVLNTSTIIIRVYAIAKDVFLKWAATGEDYCNAANFDEVIPAGQYIDVAVPYKSNGAKYQAIQVVGRESGSTVIVIEK